MPSHTPAAAAGWKPQGRHCWHCCFRGTGPAPFQLPLLLLLAAAAKPADMKQGQPERCGDRCIAAADAAAA